MLTDSNFYLYVRAYLKRYNVEEQMYHFLNNDGQGTYINRSEWKFDNIPVPTKEQLNAIPDSEIENLVDKKTTKTCLDIYTSLPTEKFEEGSMIIQQTDVDYALYVYLGGKFRLM
jgi:hypothetical protein